MEPITLAVASLVTFRVTLLVTTDMVTSRPRKWMLERMASRPMLQYLIVCNWCISFYVGLGVAGAGVVTGQWTWPWLVPLALAFSAVTGLLARGESE